MDKKTNPETLKKKHPGGRPTTYNQDLAKLICERVATNPVGLETLIQLYPDLPNSSTIKAWRQQFPEFSAWYLQAKSFQSQIMVEEIDDLIPIGVRFYLDDKGQERIDPPSASLVIAKINNRKWQAARLAPKIYGERVQLESVSNDDTEALKAELKELREKLAEKSKSEY
jgi:hypothetical protein